MYERDNVGRRFLSCTFRRICYTHLKNHSNASINGVGSKFKGGGGLTHKKSCKTKKGGFGLWFNMSNFAKKGGGGGGA